MPHLGRGKTIEELLLWFLTALESKIRRMKIPPVRVGREQELRWDMESYREMLPHLDSYRSDEAKAKALEPDYLREAATNAVKQAYAEDRADALRLLAGVLTSWRIVDALSEAFIRALGKQPKPEERIETEIELPLRYFVHADPGTADIPSVIEKISSEWGTVLGDAAILDDYGWLQGSIASIDGSSGSPDGMFFIVRVAHEQTLLRFKDWLGPILGHISTPQMLDIEPPPEAVAETAPEAVPES